MRCSELTGNELLEIDRNDQSISIKQIGRVTKLNPEIEKQYEESHTLFNKFTKGKPIDITPRGYRIPFYDRPPASDAFMGQTSAFPVPDNPIELGLLLEIAA